VLTPPELQVKAVRYLARDASHVVVQGGAEPVDRQLWSVPLAGGAATPISEGPDQHDAVYARDSSAHVLLSSGLEGWGKAEVRRADGSTAGVLPSVAATPPALPRVEVMKVGEVPGLWAALVRPRDFDPAKRYPVLVNVYGGPHGQMVYREPRAYLRLQWIADHGFLVVTIDGRGTPGRGREFERAIAGKFHDVPLADQVAGLQALAAREPALDLGRVGITGGSFGGYMAALAVLRRPDVFKAAVAASLVSDWLDYDTYYTERYLGVPGADGGVYPDNGLIKYAGDLTRPLLITHGTADDNVLFSHAVKLADALFKAGKPFELLPMPGQTHMMYDPVVSRAYWERAFQFFRTHL
jgi:dipeptidyl-peptidase-4